MSRGWLRRYMPRGLFGRSLVIIVMPVVVLQAVVTYLLFDRQWEAVTTRISRGVASQIALFVQSYETLGAEKFAAEVPRLRETSFGLAPVVKTGEKLPDSESPAYDVLKQVFVRQLATSIRRPVWVDSDSLEDQVDIRIQLDGAVMQVMADRLRGGKAVGVFPEGRTRGGHEVGPFHARIFQAAVETGVPVQPVALVYGLKGDAQTIVAFGPGESFFANFLRLLGEPARRAEVHFLAPIGAQDLEGRRRIAETSRARIVAAMSTG